MFDKIRYKLKCYFRGVKLDERNDDYHIALSSRRTQKWKVWTDAGDEETLAPKDGLYVFKCLGDNHYKWEAYPLKAGELLHSPFMGDKMHGDDWWPTVVPCAYYLVSPFREDSPEWNTLSRQPQCGEDINELIKKLIKATHGPTIAIMAIDVNGTIRYYGMNECECPFINYELKDAADGKAYWERLWDGHDVILKGIRFVPYE